MNVTTKNIRGRRSPLSENEIYVGRANLRYGVTQSSLANPFNLTNEAERAAVIARYREWLAQNIDACDAVVLGEIARIRAVAAAHAEVALFCWCAPRACHADVIAEIVATGPARDEPNP